MRVSDGWQFGERSPKGYVPFLIKVILLTVPAIVLGRLLDSGVAKLRDRQTLGASALPYIGLQVLLGASALYGVWTVSCGYASELQASLPGLFFSAIFFSIQANFFSMLTCDILPDADSKCFILAVRRQAPSTSG